MYFVFSSPKWVDNLLPTNSLQQSLFIDLVQGVFIVNFQQILHIVMVLPLLTLN